MDEPSLKFPHLFEPIQINRLRFPNRIEIAPMGNSVPNICDEFGRSGASVMTLGSWQIDDEWSQLMGYPDPFVKPIGQQVHGLEAQKNLKAQLNALQRYGMYASVELLHAGRYAHNFPAGSNKEGNAIGAVEETYLHKKGLTIHVHAMDADMIEHVAENYARAAVRFKNFGFDMIMLHFAHGWLPWQFLSPTYNKRTDEFGGSFENRARFPLMILKKVREAVGKDFPVEMRIGAKEWREGGFDVQDCIRFVKLAEPYIDLVHVSAGIDSEPELFHHVVSKNFKPHLDKIELVRQIKASTSLPVCLVGSVIYPEEAEQAIVSGACDLVAIGREAMVDTEWPKKAFEGRDEDIYPCLRCASCSEQTGSGCASNPRYGNYSLVPPTIPPAAHKLKVVIIGGGPGGMRAAITSAQRGYETILFEQNTELGGQIRNFKGDRYKTDLYLFCEFLKKQVRKYPIDVRLNTKATPDLIRTLNPDAVVIAIGAMPVQPHIDGMDQTKITVLQAVDVYEHPENVKGRTAIIGGGATGIETALFLADLGHPCDVIEMAKEIAAAEHDINWRSQLEWILKQYERLIHIHTSARVMRFAEDGLEVEENNRITKVTADTVILSIGFRPKKEEADGFYGICYKTYKIGDCYQVRKLGSATNEGFFRIMGLE